MAMPREDYRSVGDLISDLVGQSSALFRKEAQLVRAEVSESVAKGVAAIAAIIGGAVLLIGAINVLMGAAVTGLIEAGIEAPWAALIVAIGVGIVGFILIRSGLSAVSAKKLVPQRTANQLQRDATLIKEQVK